MSMFDPNAFMSMTFEDANSTQTVPVPVGEYTAIAGEPEIKQWQSRDGESSGLKLNILWSVEDEAVKQLLGREKVTVRQEMMLDLTESGGLDFGKGRNVGLGRLREALKMNEPGKPFAFPMIAGQMAKIVVSHRPDKNDPEKVYSEVKAVARL